MAQVIHKHLIPLDADVEVPGTPIHVGIQSGEVHVWSLLGNSLEVDGNAPVLRIYATGQPVPDKATYVGSAMHDSFVWHVFDIRNI